MEFETRQMRLGNFPYKCLFSFDPTSMNHCLQDEELTTNYASFWTEVKQIPTREFDSHQCRVYYFALGFCLHDFFSQRSQRLQDNWHFGLNIFQGWFPCCLLCSLLFEIFS